MAELAEAFRAQFYLVHFFTVFTGFRMTETRKTFRD